VEDCQIAGYAALNKLFEDNVSSGNSHLGAAIGRVVNLYCNARTSDGLPTKLKAREWVTWHINLNDLFHCVSNFFNRLGLATTRASGKNN
jgi:hypothetical protein